VRIFDTRRPLKRERSEATARVVAMAVRQDDARRLREAALAEIVLESGT